MSRPKVSKWALEVPEVVREYSVGCCTPFTHRLTSTFTLSQLQDISEQMNQMKKYLAEKTTKDEKLKGLEIGCEYRYLQ